VVCAWLCLALAACGEGPEPAAVARDYVASNDASKCDVLSPRLVEQLTGKRGDAALAACRRNVVRYPAPKDVRIRDGEESEREATETGEAEVELIADGREAAVTLEKEDGRWRIVRFGE
jgi:hypothetical protein